MTKVIQFKTKTYAIMDGDVERRAFNYKKAVEKKDCNLKPHEHKWYNSDMFTNMLNRTYRSIIGEYRTWSFVDDLPENVSIDTSGFLATVTIFLPEEFFK
jgi:hypothetical protein